MQHDSLRSPLSKARGLGSAKTGFSHWWVQRLTALALIPLALWFVFEINHTLIYADRFAVALWLENPLHALLLAGLLVALFMHARLGIQTVIEDYVHTESKKVAMLIINTFFFFTLTAMSLMAIFKLHFFGI